MCLNRAKFKGLRATGGNTHNPPRGGNRHVKHLREREDSGAGIPYRETRRHFLRRAAVGGAALMAGGSWTVLSGGKRPRISRLTVRLPDLPLPLDGFTICQLSDLHRGPLVPAEHLQHWVRLAMSLEADLIVITGDFVSVSARYAPSCAAALAPLRARYGVFGVLGNHDYWTGDAEGVRAALTRAGVQVLMNGSVRLNVNGVEWWLCGIDDVWSGSPDLDAALREVPEGAFHILLCHEPDFADTAAARNVPLQLSGHSHGGQVRLPLVGAPLLPYLGQKYPWGLQRVANSGTLVYTNVGLGVSFPPIRFNSPPEITLLTLKRGSAV